MKTIVLLVIAGLFASAGAIAQTNHPPYNHLHDVTAEEEALSALPEELSVGHTITNAWFPDLKTYVAENTRYPMAAKEAGIEGVVEAEGTVGADGKLKDIRITDGLGYQCDKEVRRLLSGMPAWNPARSDGRPFEQKVFLRFRFKLKPL
jgi:TonB family protein